MAWEEQLVIVIGEVAHALHEVKEELSKATEAWKEREVVVISEQFAKELADDPTLSASLPDVAQAVASLEENVADHEQQLGRLAASAMSQAQAAAIRRQEETINQLRAELKEEKRLHEGDHEILAIVTGDPGAHMWHPHHARSWVAQQRKRAEGKLKTTSPEPEREFRSVRISEEVASQVRGGGTGAGGIKYDDAVKALREFEGKPVSFAKLAEVLKVLPCQAERLATDLLMSRHAVGLLGGLDGYITLHYEPTVTA